MYDPVCGSLHMGICIDPAFEKKYLSSPIASHFIDKEKLLKKVVFCRQMYLAKPLPAFTKLEELKDMQRHIMSVFAKLAPEYPIPAENIRIFAISLQ